MENYRKLTEIYKRIQRYPSMSIPPGTDTEKSSMGGTLIKWNSPMLYIYIYIYVTRVNLNTLAESLKTAVW